MHPEAASRRAATTTEPSGLGCDRLRGIGAGLAALLLAGCASMPGIGPPATQPAILMVTTDRPVLSDDDLRSDVLGGEHWRGHGAAAPAPTTLAWSSVGRDLGLVGGTLHIAGAVQLSPARDTGRPAIADFGPSLGYRADPYAHLTTELIGSYFYSRKRWVGHTFVGYRSAEGWAIGPEVWRYGDGISRCNGGGLAVHDLRLAPLRIGLRLGIETRSALGHRYIGGVDLSWDSR